MVLYQLCFVDDAHPFGYEYLCDITCALWNKYVWDFVYWQSEIFYPVDKVDKDTYSIIFCENCSKTSSHNGIYFKSAADINFTLYTIPH